MAKKLLIIGNGFDLHFNLKTDFASFFNNVKITKSAILDKNLIFILLNMTFYNSNTKDELQEIFKIDSTENWMDVELLISRFLISSVYTKTKQLFENFVRNGNGYNGHTLLYYLFQTSYEHLYRKQISFEDFVFSQLKEFEDNLVEYLNEINNQFNGDKGILLDKLNCSHRYTKIMNFNYTNPCEDRILDINYVHGSLSKRNIIIGIDRSREEKNKNEYDYIFTKTYRKLFLTAEQQKIDHCFDKDIERIVFYGHSLGEQDYSYFQSTFDFYHIYDSNVILEFCYSNYNVRKLGNDHELKLTVKRAFRLINNYGDSLDNKDHGKNLLHKMLLEGRILFTCIRNYKEVKK